MTPKTNREWQRAVEERLTRLEHDLTTVSEALIRLRAGLASLTPRRAPRRRIAPASAPRLVGGSRC